MARPKQFDRDEALNQAVEVFWAQGYDATSMSDLGKGMGIGRQSLYDTFGDKQRLFGEALARYRQWNEQGLDEAFPPGAGLEAIRRHLINVVHIVTRGSPRRGCLLMHSCSQVAPHDPAIALSAQAGLAAMKLAFARALEQGQADGEVRSDVNPEVAAALLTGQAAGLNVVARAGASVEELLAVVDCAIDGLRP